MPLINIDLEDGLSKVSFTLMPGDAERFMAFMAECDSYKNQRDELLAAVKDARRELHACQAVIHLHGGFDPEYVKGALAAIKKADAAIAKAEATNHA